MNDDVERELMFKSTEFIFSERALKRVVKSCQLSFKELGNIAEAKDKGI